MEFVIGGLAAASAGVLTNPIEVMKHHIEMNKKSPVNEKYKNFLEAGYKVAKQNGVKSLQKGLSPNIAAYVASYGMKLGTYQFAQRHGYTTNQNGEVVLPMSVASSAVGGIVGQYASSPFYLVKTHMELDKDQHEKKTFSQAAAKIYREHGARGFLRGATASLPRAFIGTSQLTSFAYAKENISKQESFKDAPMLATLLAGTFAGVVLSVATTPFDMILTKLYKQAIGPKKSKPVYDGFLDCARKTFFKDGFRPFYRGLGPLYLKLGPHTALCLVFWEQLKEMYENSESMYDRYNPKLNIYNEHFGDMGGHDNSSELYW